MTSSLVEPQFFLVVSWVQESADRPHIPFGVSAESLTGLEFWNVRQHSLADIWANSPAFNAFRGTAWMKEPCASCSRRELDFGGCRCQAFALAGDAAATDPVCHLVPDHARVAELAAVQTDAPYVYRRIASRHRADVFEGDSGR
jgi:radical SAM protein with 4Fe4S-binding SPASM domain